MTAEGPNDEQARMKRQRARSVAIAISLGVMALLFYAATIVRLGPNAIRSSDFRSPPQSSEEVAPTTDAEACKKAGTC